MFNCVKESINIYRITENLTLHKDFGDLPFSIHT